MITLEKVVNIDLKDLITYKESLEIVSNMYETRLMPMYGKVSSFDRPSSEQQENARKLQDAKQYLKVIMEAIEYKTYKELNEIEEGKDLKKKLNVKKNSKKV